MTSAARGEATQGRVDRCPSLGSRGADITRQLAAIGEVTMECLADQPCGKLQADRLEPMESLDLLGRLRHHGSL